MGAKESNYTGALRMLWSIFPPKPRSADEAIAIEVFVGDIIHHSSKKLGKTLSDLILNAEGAPSFCQDSPVEKINPTSPFRLIVDDLRHKHYLELTDSQSIVYGIDERYILLRFKDKDAALRKYVEVAEALVEDILVRHGKYKAEILATLQDVPIENLLVMANLRKRGTDEQGILYGFIDKEYNLQLWVSRGFTPEPVHGGFPLVRILGPKKEPEDHRSTLINIATIQLRTDVEQAMKNLDSLLKLYRGQSFSSEHVDPS